MAESYSNKFKSSDVHYGCHGSNSNICNEKDVSGVKESDDAQRTQLLRMVDSCRSYCNNFIRASNWFIRHPDFNELTQRYTDCYERYCQSQIVYHAEMAYMFYTEWLNLHRQTLKASSVMSRPHDNCSQYSTGHGFEKTDRCTSAQRSKRRARPRKSAKRSRSRRNRKKLSGHSQCYIEVHLRDQSSNENQLDLIFDGTDSTEFEMEITEDMKEFFTQSARHRKERDSKKQNPSGCDIIVGLSEVSFGKTKATIEPPKERPDEQRNKEMKELYGMGSAMVHAMETAMQLTFDRNLARQQPHLWPALPINFNCDSTRRLETFKTLKTAFT